MLRGTTLLDARPARPALSFCNGNVPAGIGRWPTGGLVRRARFQPVARSLRLAAWTRALPVNKGIIYHDRIHSGRPRGSVTVAAPRHRHVTIGNIGATSRLPLGCLFRRSPRAGHAAGAQAPADADRTTVTGTSMTE